MLNIQQQCAIPIYEQDIQLLEHMQKLALRVCSNHGTCTGYSELLDLFHLPTLENRRLYLKFCHLFKLVHRLCYFPTGTVVSRPNTSNFSRLYSLQQPFTCTKSFICPSSQTPYEGGIICLKTLFVP